MTEEGGKDRPTLAVTGSTGALGGMVCAMLADAGVAQRLLVRSLERAPRLPGAVAVEAEYADDDRTRAALGGVETLFMVSASENERRLDQHRGFIDAATAAGVRHIVYTSFVGASPTATFTLARDHDATERHIEACGVPYTFLRDNLYLDFMPLLLGDDDVIRGPGGDGRAAVVARRDIARVATTVLADPLRHVGRTYELTGPQALSFGEIAHLLGEHLGRPVAYHAETVPEAYASRAPFGAPGWQVDAWVSTYTAVAAGEMSAVSDDIAELTGEPPISMERFLAGQRT
jgi:uncharacterized protein YbjT (DUF2867 family)